MRFCRYHILFLFLLLFATIGLGQERKPIAVHFDKTFYVLGETVWYRALCMEDSKASQVMEVQIADQSGTVKLHQRLLMENNCAFGDFRIPLDWNEGLYIFNLLIKTGPDKALLYQRNLPVFNDMTETVMPSPVNLPADQTLPANSGGLNIQIQTNKQAYQRGEKISALIQVTDQNGRPVQGNFSLAVTDHGLTPLLPVAEQVKEIDYSQNPVSEGQLLFSGMIKDKETGAGKKMNLIAIFNVDEVGVNWGRSQNDGMLSFALPPFYGDREVQIRNFDLFGPSASFSVDMEPAIPNDLLQGPYSWNLPDRTAAINQYLYWSRERKRIEQIMGFGQLDLSHKTIETSTRIPDRTYPVADYIAFNSFEEFLDEVVLPARLRERKGERELRLINPNTKVWYEKAPLYLLDGYITTKEENILNLKLEEIERIDLYIDHNTLTNQFGVLGGNGVMAVYTKNRGTKLTDEDLANTFSIKGFHRSRSFTLGQGEDNDHQPDFRSVIYWNPNIQTDANGKASVEFYHSDDISRFLLEITGSAAGQFGRAYATYVCKP